MKPAGLFAAFKNSEKAHRVMGEICIKNITIVMIPLGSVVWLTPYPNTPQFESWLNQISFREYNFSMKVTKLQNFGRS